MLSAVISKMQVKTARDFGSTGGLTMLECVCENDLMAAYAESEENRCFTKYSPWGEAAVGKWLFSGMIETMRGRQLYVVVTRRSDGFKCAGALAVLEARVTSVTDFGDNQARVVEVSQSFTASEKVGLNMRTAIDNPPAVGFFEPGKDDYRVAFFDAAEFNRDTALAAVFAERDDAGER